VPEKTQKILIEPTIFKRNLVPKVTYGYIVRHSFLQYRKLVFD